AKAEVVHSALELLASDPRVKGILINIFGGITRGDEVAHGIIDATRDLNLNVPLVVRMTGTREEEGRQLLREAGIPPEAGASPAATSAAFSSQPPSPPMRSWKRRPPASSSSFASPRGFPFTTWCGLGRSSRMPASS